MSYKENRTPEQWDAMTTTQRDRFITDMERSYTAANGHKMHRNARYVFNSGHDARPIYSSAYSTCTYDCPACDDGYQLGE